MREQEHRYGPNVHLVGTLPTLTLLARLCAKGTEQPQIDWLVKKLYEALLGEVLAGGELPSRAIESPTRMIEVTPKGVWVGDVINRKTQAVVIANARAGILPAQVVYEFLNHVLQPKRVREDHFAVGRTTDSLHRVTGAVVHSAKIGGPVDDATLLMPDPMGATGGTTAAVLQRYATEKRGTPRKVVLMHLIVTPEYLREVLTKHPEAIVYALRVDRGLSDSDVLASVPGTHWDKEHGLTDVGYIVPGGGGLGEAFYNANC